MNGPDGPDEALLEEERRRQAEMNAYSLFRKECQNMLDQLQAMKDRNDLFYGIDITATDVLDQLRAAKAQATSDEERERLNRADLLWRRQKDACQQLHEVRQQYHPLLDAKRSEWQSIQELSWPNWVAASQDLKDEVELLQKLVTKLLDH